MSTELVNCEKSTADNNTPSTHADIQTPLTTNDNLSSLTKHSDKAFMNMEAKFSALKGYIDCQISILNSKVDLFIDSLKETITKIEKRENHNIEILQEKIRFLQKELLAKNDLIKSLMETQTVALEAITNLKEALQAQQEFSNISYKQPIQQHHQGHQNNHQKFLKNTKQQQNHHHQFLNQRQQQELLKEQEQQQRDGKQQQKHQQKLQHQTQQQQQQQQKQQHQQQQQIQLQQQQKLNSHQSKTIFVSNLHQSVTVDDLYELIGLRSTNYLRNNCHIEMDHFSNPDQPIASATVTAPAHVCEELLKLHGIDIHDNPLIAEMSKSPLEQSNHYFQPPLQPPPIQQVIHSYGNTVNTKRKDIALFADSIPKGMKTKDINSRIKDGKIHLK